METNGPVEPNKRPSRPGIKSVYVRGSELRMMNGILDTANHNPRVNSLVDAPSRRIESKAMRVRRRTEREDKGRGGSGMGRDNRVGNTRGPRRSVDGSITKAESEGMPVNSARAEVAHRRCEIHLTL